MKIIVLAGGFSTERNVSFSSGVLVANALIENGHEVMLLDLFLGACNKDFPPQYRNKPTYKFDFPEKEPELDELKNLNGSDSLIESNVLRLCKEADVVFIALHGSIGENGQLQALFDINNISYTGSGYIGCLLAMEKDVSKKLFKANNILTPNWYVVENGNFEINSQLDFPCIVKPCSNGSSVGVSLVNSIDDYLDALKKAFLYEDKVIVEQYISGREISVGVLGGDVLPIIEIMPNNNFYDYQNKYQKGYASEVCPARIDKELEKDISKEVLKIHKALHLGYYSRIDFIIEQNSNRIYCLEANALPGLTPTSLLPQEAFAEGINFNALCEAICQNPFCKQ